MGLVVLPHALTDGTDAYGSHVKANDDAIVTVVNGSIDDTNIKSGANINGSKLLDGSLTGAKLANLTVTGGKMADLTITAGKIADDTITAVKLASDDTLGEGVNDSRLYSGAGEDGTSGYPGTNINAGRKVHGGTTLWAYFTIGTVATRYNLDDSIDWRNRLIHVTAMMIDNATKTYIPGGVNDNQMRNRMFIAGNFIALAFPTSAIKDSYNACFFFSESGSTNGAAQPYGQLTLWEAGTNEYTINFSAKDTDGTLTYYCTNFGTATTCDVCLKIECSPKLV